MNGDAQGRERQQRLRHALSLQGDGDIEGAWGIGLALVDEHPDLAGAWQLLGTLALIRGQPHAALDALGRAQGLDSGNAVLMVNLGIAHQALGRLSEAEAWLRRATERAPDFAGAWSNLSTVVLSSGRAGEAISAAEQALRLDPGLHDARMNLGLALERTGRLDEAEARYRETLDGCPNHELAFAGLVRVGQVPGSMLSRMEAIARADRLDPLRQRVLHFALAHGLDAAGDPTAALSHAQAGNALRAQLFGPFDAQAQAARHERIRAQAQRLSQLHRSERPIFIVGFPRSGTSLAERLLASHPEIVAGGERTLLSQLGERSLDSAPDRAWMEGAADALMAEGVHTRKRPGDLEWLGLLAALLPDARVVYCVRDRFDACMSCFFQDFMHPHRWKHAPDTLALAYRRHEDLMAHWLRTLPLAVHTLSYEALVADPQAQTEALWAFCGLGLPGEQLLGETGFSDLTLSPRQAQTQEISPHSARRWAPYRALMPELT